MKTFINLIGKRFYYLTVVERLPNDKFNKIVWKCRCDCGNITKAITQHLNNGNIKSCGCIKALKHGHTKNGKRSRTYQSWDHMIQRCTNSNNGRYKDYGGRIPPITVCDRWNIKKGGSFENFLNDMGERPKNKTLDRINNNLGYYKENCKWSTRNEQQRNKRNNRVEIFNNKTQYRIDLAKEHDIKINTLNHRLDKMGLSVKEALTTPLKRRK